MITEHDAVNHPKHYTEHPSGIECIQITEHMGFNLGNAVKYIWRADLKGAAIEDLRKAIWYVQREITKRESAEHNCIPAKLHWREWNGGERPVGEFEQVEIVRRDDVKFSRKADDVDWKHSELYPSLDIVRYRVLTD